jgi:uncharacterized protein (DUF2062 family)
MIMEMTLLKEIMAALIMYYITHILNIMKVKLFQKKQRESNLKKQNIESIHLVMKKPKRN